MTLVGEIPLRPSTAAFVVFVAVVGSFYIYQAAAKAVRRRNIQAQFGCRPVRRFPQKPLLGLDTAWASLQASKHHRLLETIRTRFRHLGSRTFSLAVLGRTRVYTVEPENLKAIMATSFQEWALPGMRKAAFAPVIGDGIFTLDDAGWKHSREMLKPNFARHQVGNLDMLESHTSKLVQAAEQAMATSGSVDLGALFFRLTTDSATELLFGQATHFLENPKDEFAEAFDSSLDFVGLVSRIGSLAYLFKPNKVTADGKFLHDFVDRYVDQALAGQQQAPAEKSEADDHARYTFVNELARQTSDRVRIRSELLNILLAGRDTTASLLTNLWWVLARRPDVFDRLRKEVTALAGEEVTLESLRSLKYLQAVLKECLRLYPVVPLNSREARHATTLPKGGGDDGSSPALIPAGTTVVWSLYAMHRDPELFGPDADVFNPDRWLDDHDTGARGLRPGWEYLPFNGGPRICLGQQFALNEAGYATLRLCQAFAAVEARDERPWTEMLTVTCVNLHGARVALTPEKT